jgi:hypothetical protein
MRVATSSSARPMRATGLLAASFGGVVVVVGHRAQRITARCPRFDVFAVCLVAFILIGAFGICPLGFVENLAGRHSLGLGSAVFVDGAGLPVLGIAE